MRARTVHTMNPGKDEIGCARTGKALGVGDATTEAGEGFVFVGEGGNGVDEAGELEDFADVAERIQELEAAALAFEGDE